MKQCFRDCNFRPGTLEFIERINSVLAEYDQALTARQLYYQFVTKNWITNDVKSYKRLTDICSEGRIAGLIDWNAIEDRARQPVIWAEYDSIADVLEDAGDRFALRYWQDQPRYAELWVEKDALAGVLRPLASKHHATLMVNRGYSSSSAMYEAANRLIRKAEDKEEAVIFYLGDHDPSGEDMVRDIRERLELFGVQNLRVKKIGLTMEQIKKFNPPPQPVKHSDVRTRQYEFLHGSKCWEVDALPPKELNRIIDAEFKAIKDHDLWNAVKARETEQRDRLRDFIATLEE